MSNGKSPKKGIDPNNYQDPIKLSPKNLELGLWIASNHKLIYKSVIILLASLATIFFLYSGYGYFYYFVFGREQERIIEGDQSGLDLAAYRAQNIPIDLKYDQARVIATNLGSDFVVHLKNVNEKQSANFDFCFTTGGNEACGSGFILPNEEKNITLLNTNVRAANGQALFTLKNIAWQKLKAGEIPDWNAYRAERLNFTIKDSRFLTYGDNISYLELSVTNNSSYGYFEVPLNITMSNNGDVLAVNRYIVKDFNSQETKLIRLAWPEAVNLSGTITVIPELNLLDSSIYKLYGSN